MIGLSWLELHALSVLWPNPLLQFVMAAVGLTSALRGGKL